MKLSDYIILVNINAKMAVKAEASRFFFSFLWWIFEPLMMVLAFYFVFNILLKNGQENYLLFLVCAKVPYMWFSKSVTAASVSILSQKGIISQLNIPKAIFPYAAIQVSLYKESPVLVLLALTCFAYGFFPTLDWFWLIPIIMLEYLVIVSFGLLTALLMCYAEDVRILVNLLMLLLMFISGIFFDLSSLGEMGTYMLMFNPIAFICDAFRVVLMHKGMYDINHMFILFAVFSLLVAGLHIMYNKLNYHMAARVINS